MQNLILRIFYAFGILFITCLATVLYLVIRLDFEIILRYFLDVHLVFLLLKCLFLIIECILLSMCCIFLFLMHFILICGNFLGSYLYKRYYIFYPRRFFFYLTYDILLLFLSMYSC